MAVIALDDFRGGLNVKDSPFYMADNESPDCVNVVFTTTGEAEIRKGYSLLVDTGVPSQVIGLYKFATPSISQLLIVVGNKLILFEGNTARTLIDSLAADTRYSFDTWGWKGLAFIVNGVDTPMKWDGTSLSPVGGSPPIARYVSVYAERLWLAGGASPTTLRWSGLANPDSWPPENVLEVAQPITGLVPMQGSLWIFQEDRIDALVGTGGLETTEGVRTIVNNLGCVAPNTLAVYGRLVMFLSKDGVYSFDGHSVVKVSSKLDPVFQGASPVQWRAASAAIYKGRYWLSWPGFGSASPNEIYVYDIENGWWSKFLGIKAFSLHSLTTASEKQTLYSGDENGRVWIQDVGMTDNDVAVRGYWKSKLFIPAIGFISQYRRISVRTAYTIGEYKIEWFVDGTRQTGAVSFGSIGEKTLWGKFLWGQGKWSGQPAGLVKSESMPMRAVGQTIQLLLSLTGSGRLGVVLLEFYPKRRVMV